VVIGQGYVGLVVAMRASEAGFAVMGVESDPIRANALADGRSYVEDVPDTVLRSALERGYRVLRSARGLPRFDVAVIAVPTPLRDGRPDLAAIESAAESVGRSLQRGALVVLESTTYPGTTSEVLVPTLEAVSGLRCGTDFLVGYSPERIDPGNPQFTLTNTPKIVSGVDPASLAAVKDFYGAFVPHMVEVARPEEAELAKLLENTFRHVNVALVNELAVFAHELGVDLWAAIDAAATKPFGFMAFRPGPGVGGHCLPVDPSYLSWRCEEHTGVPFRFVKLANDVNAGMPKYVVDRVCRWLQRDGVALEGARILVLGVAYKAGTGDTREAPSLHVVTELQRRGAEVRAVDPYVTPGLESLSAPLIELSDAGVRDADLVLVLTDHREFDFAHIAQTARRVLDTRHCVPVDGRGVVEVL
jgi:nucleotide sugar dehydrogenase